MGGTAYHVVLTHKVERVVLDEGRSPTLRDIVWLPNPLEANFAPPAFTIDEALKWKALLPANVMASILDDGFDLLRRNGLTQRRIENLSFSNPFPFAFRAPSPRGVALWWDKDRTFTVDKLTPLMVIGDADVIMVAKLWWDYANVQFLMQVAQERLRQGFTPIESQYWTAWVRK